MFESALEKKIEERFETRMKKFGQFGQTLMDETALMKKDKKILFQYLYTVLPGSDLGNYSSEVLGDFVDHGIHLWKESSYASQCGAEMFLQYILLPRVNDEEIRPCRRSFYDELKDRIAGKSESEAALEVNYWCAENASYESSDDRTLSAIAVYESASGRCGEESTFLVNALRSVGLAARQVYAPKWSHCDDNHAWVEVFADGQWRFMGACEPEEILDKGWFLSASSRAIVINTKYFGAPLNSEKFEDEVIQRDGIVTMLNQLPRYANTQSVTFTVTTQDGQAVSGAKVEISIINYARFATIASGETDENGCLNMTLGCGTVRVRANKDGQAAETFVEVQTESKINLVLAAKKQIEENRIKNDEIWQDFDFNAPVDDPIHFGRMTLEQKAVGKVKFAKANAKRLDKSRNYVNKHLEEFLKASENEELGKALLNTLSNKDRRDAVAEILEEHLIYGQQWKSEFPGEDGQRVFEKYVLNPRIKYEPLSCYRKFISEYFTDEEKSKFREEPIEIQKYIEDHLTFMEEEEYSELVTLPVACLKRKQASTQSKKILFVAIARTLGIPAAIHSVDGEISYIHDGKMHYTMPRKYGQLVLKPAEGTQWTYGTNWSIEMENESGGKTLRLKENLLGKEPLAIKLPEGRYKVITSNRLPNGSIFASSVNCVVSDERAVFLSMAEREAKLEDMLESIKLQPFTLKDEVGNDVEAASITGNGQKILFFLEEGKEPTEHILNELMENKERFCNWQENLYFVVRTKDALKDRTISKCMVCLPKISVYFDDFSDLVNTLGRALYVDPERLPLIFVTNGPLETIYATSGYNVGTADMLLKIMVETAKATQSIS